MVSVPGKSALSGVVKTAGTLATIMMATLEIIAVSIRLGWFDPEPPVFADHMSTAASTVVETVGGFVWEKLAEVMP